MAGMSHAEPDGRWTDGPVARLRFARRLPRRFRLELDIVDVYPPNRGRPLTARVGNDIREVRLPHNPDTVRLTFESRAPGNTIELHIPQPTSPASRGESRDMRLLGIRVKMLRVVELPE
jgi:phage-related protein